MKLTRENCETADRFEHVSEKNSDSTKLRARRNGKTKLWKRQPGRFQIPAKHGLRGYFYITEYDAHNWEVV